ATEANHGTVVVRIALVAGLEQVALYQNLTLWEVRSSAEIRKRRAPVLEEEANQLDLVILPFQSGVVEMKLQQFVSILRAHGFEKLAGERIDFGSMKPILRSRR